MKISKRLLLPALLLASPVSLAQTQDSAPRAEARAQDTISVQFRGSLRDAIQKIAEEGGLNVVVTGDLDSPAEVRLKNVSAEQALRTVARAYSLKIDQDNGIYTLRPLTGAEKAQANAVPSPPPPPGAPMPAVGPVPPPGPDVADEVAQSAVDEDEVKERVREKLKEARRHHGSRDVVSRGRPLEVKEGETVDSAVVYGGNLAVNGHVDGDAVVFGGNLVVNGQVEGDAHAFGGNVMLGPNAVVEGDVSSFGGQVLKQNGAKVEGSTESFGVVVGGANIGRMIAGEIKEDLKHSKRHASDDDADTERKERDSGGGFAGFLLTFAMLFGLGFLGQILFPARMKELGAEVRAQPVKDGVVGLLGALALIPTLLVLTVTIIGIPLVVALLIVVPLVTALGFAAVASELGTRMPVLVGRKTQALVLALGLFILLVVGRIPVLGPLVLVLASFVALGAVIRTRFGNRPRGIPEPIMSDRMPA